MKKVALFLLLLFAAVQVIPLVMTALGVEKTLIFNVDEEKNNGKAQNFEDKKEKKDLLALLLSPVFESKNKTSHGIAGNKIPSTPFLEKMTPPPNRIA